MICLSHFTFEMCFTSQRHALFQHLNFQKCSEPPHILTLFTSKCASRHTDVDFSNISTSKSAPSMVCCANFDIELEMCFAPKPRALFQHLNFQKCSGSPQFLTLLTLTRASRHNDVHFFKTLTSKSAPNLSVLNTFDFQMCFEPQRRTLFQHLNFQKCS